jgi:rSAM/selenodomain-associated transferase 2
MAEVRLSIVVPTLDEAGTIGTLLSDLAPWRDAGAEIILADGGSEDDTRARAAGRVDRIVDAPRGRAAQMNAGAAAARGDCLWFLHADTRVPEAARTALGQALRDGARWGRFDVRLSGRRWPFRVIERLMNWRSCLTRIATGDQGLFVQRALFESVGGFPGLPLMEDIALSKRLKRVAPMRCIRRPALVTSSRRWEEKGIWRTVLLMWRLRLAYALGDEPATIAARYDT